MKFAAISLSGGILTTLFLALFIELPLTGLFIAPLIALPTSVISVRWGIKIALWSVIIAMMFSLAIFKFEAIPVFLLVTLIALFFHFSRQKSGRLINYIVTTATLAFLVLVAFFYQYELLSPKSTAPVARAFDQSIKDIEKEYLLGVPQKELDRTIKELNEAVGKVKLLIPSLYAIGLLSFFLINIALTKVAANRLGSKENFFAPFNNWDIHWLFSWGFIFGIASQLFSNKLPGDLRAIGSNFTLFFSVIFIIQGISVASFFLSKWKISIFVKTAALIMLMIASPVLYIISWIGLFDVWFNYRKLERVA